MMQLLFPGSKFDFRRTFFTNLFVNIVTGGMDGFWIRNLSDIAINTGIDMYYGEDASFNPTSRRVCSSTYATDENHNRNWLDRIVAQLVRSANKNSCCSLMRFSISPRAQYFSSYNGAAAISSRGSDVTTNRGFSPLAMYSTLPTTRRGRLQLSRV